MNQPEPENTLANYSNDIPILSPFAYPDAKSICRLFFVLIFYLFLSGVLNVVLLELFKYLGYKEAILKSFVELLTYVIGFLLVIRYGIKKIKKQESSFRINFNKIQGLLIPVFIISTIALYVGLDRVSELIPMPESMEKFFEEAFRKDIFSIIAMVIAAPILEEILCRGIILKGLLKNYSPHKAILISALFFGLMHLNPWQAIPAFFGGLFIGWAYYKTGSVIPGMIIHATNNALSVPFLFLPKNKQDILSLSGEPYYIILCVLSVLIFICGCIIIHKKAIPVSREQEVALYQEEFNDPEAMRWKSAESNDLN